MRLGTCRKCGRERMVNFCTRDGRPFGQLCGDCFDRVWHDEPDRERAGRPGPRDEQDPGFDNVIRASEDDR